jgi:hypothetical protein
VIGAGLRRADAMALRQKRSMRDWADADLWTPPEADKK